MGFEDIDTCGIDPLSKMDAETIVYNLLEEQIAVIVHHVVGEEESQRLKEHLRTHWNEEWARIRQWLVQHHFDGNWMQHLMEFAVELGDMKECMSDFENLLKLEEDYWKNVFLTLMQAKILLHK